MSLKKKLNKSNRKKSKINNRNTKYVCYTGVGAKKNGTHTEDEFINIMKKNGKISCSKYKKSMKCKPCIKRKKILSKIKQKRKKNKKNKLIDKLMEKEEQLFDNCLDCQENTNQDDICNFQDYINWSGADLGKCKK